MCVSSCLPFAVKPSVFWFEYSGSLDCRSWASTSACQAAGLLGSRLVCFSAVCTAAL